MKERHDNTKLWDVIRHQFVFAGFANGEWWLKHKNEGVGGAGSMKGKEGGFKP